MPTILREDDLAPDLHVAIHSHKLPVPIQSVTSPDGDSAVHIHGPPPGSFSIPPGVPLKILAISQPFALCAHLRCDGTYHGPISLDLRTVHLTRLDPTYISALITFAAAQPPPPPPASADTFKALFGFPSRDDPNPPPVPSPCP